MKLSYSGYMRVTMSTNEENKHLIGKCLYFGSWINMRAYILNKPRKYVFEIGVIGTNNELAIDEITVLDNVTYNELSQLLAIYSNEMINEHQDLFNIKEVYAVIRA